MSISSFVINSICDIYNDPSCFHVTSIPNICFGFSKSFKQDRLPNSTFLSSMMTLSFASQSSSSTPRMIIISRLMKRQSVVSVSLNSSWFNSLKRKWFHYLDPSFSPKTRFLSFMIYLRSLSFRTIAFGSSANASRSRHLLGNAFLQSNCHNFKRCWRGEHKLCKTMKWCAKGKNEISWQCISSFPQINSSALCLYTRNLSLFLCSRTSFCASRTHSQVVSVFHHTLSVEGFSLFFMACH